MRVTSLIRRPGGHVVTMEGEAYAFQPPTWACAVTRPAHVARFQAIPEGYRVTPEPLELTAPPAPAAVSGDTPAAPLGPGPGPRRRGRPRPAAATTAEMM